MAIDNDSGEFIAPLKTYLDSIEIYDAELGGIVPAWKSLIYHGAKAKHFAQMRADSVAAISEEARKGKPSGEPKLAPPLVADSDKDDDPVMERVLQAISDLETRLDQFETRKRGEAAQQERAEAALALAEAIAEQSPSTLLDALPSVAPNPQRLN
jgi:hypothetical protein